MDLLSKINMIDSTDQFSASRKKGIIKELRPSDNEAFKKELIKSKCAQIEIIYDDGSKGSEQWNADRFTESSDLWNNINSKIGHRRDKDRIVKVIFTAGSTKIQQTVKLQKKTTKRGLLSEIDNPTLKECLHSEMENILKVLKADLQFQVEDRPIIIFRHRKKKITDWFERVCDFLLEQRNLDNLICRETVYLIGTLIPEVLNADSITLPGNDSDFENTLRDILTLIRYHATNKSVKKKAENYSEECKIAPKFSVLLGEYVHKEQQEQLIVNVHLDGLDGIDNRSKIVLYLDNIHDTAEKYSYSEQDLQKSVLAHECLHFFHYYVGTRSPDRFVSKGKLYDPGKIVIESLASWFEWYYTKEYLKNSQMADNLKRSWKTPADQYWIFWPYAGAVLIRDMDHFKEIFDASVYVDFDEAKRILL